jgi:phosphatidylserine/phosphatidylglycerophosphate/cardiolipin synthase-like enzyme
MRKLIPWLLLVLAAALGCEGGEPLSLPSLQDQLGTTSNGKSGAIRVYFTRPVGSPSDPDNPAAALAGYIGTARHSIDVCAFELDNQVIVNALLDAVRRGVKVRLVTETDYLEESGVVALRGAGVPIVDDQRDGSLMHNKFMVFDNQAVWTGSMNFTENCAYRNNNHGIYLDDQYLAENYATKFAWMFEQKKFGGLPARTARIPHPAVILKDGTRVENYFATHDHVADELIKEIDQARSSIRFLAFSFTHNGMCEAMLNRARFGVPVTGVFEKSQAASSYSAYNKLRALPSPATTSTAAKVEVYVDANPRNLHHKVIIIDSETTVAGSFNFSLSADQSNDENTLIIHSRDVARQFEFEFQRLFLDAKNAAGTVAAR